MNNIRDLLNLSKYKFLDLCDLNSTTLLDDEIDCGLIHGNNKAPKPSIPILNSTNDGNTMEDVFDNIPVG
ncbi:unnamed protein product, partial [Rotaria sp. Silwood2]